MSDAYPNVFKPIQIGPVPVSNRFYMPPHGISQFTAGGEAGSRWPTEDYAYYFAERAAGGVGLICHSMTPYPRDIFSSAYYEEAVPVYKGLADRVHENGARIFAQLWYQWNLNPLWEAGAPAVPVLAVSAAQHPTHFHVTYELSREDLKGLIGVFVRNVHNLRAAGYDGIILHCSHDAIHEHFLSPFHNRRTDEYGGSSENRMRYVVETLEAIRDAAGTEMAVGIRYTPNELLPGSLTMDESKTILGRLGRERLIDFVDLDHPEWNNLMLTNYLVPPLEQNARECRELRESGALDGVVVMSCARRVTSVAQAEQLIADGAMDMVGAVRGLIAEPELIKNAREGHEERSRVCVACNQQQGAGRIGQGGAGFTCVLNPAAGRERRWGARTYTPVPHPVRLIVVGAGPAGLEAARVAATRGNEVMVLERAERVGGQLLTWGRLPGRGVFEDAVSWWRGRLDELGVDVHTGVEATAETVLAERPEAVIVATGSRYAADGDCAFQPGPIPGCDHDFVLTPERILIDGVRPAGTVVVMDEEGINTGIGIVELLARAGARVIHVSTRGPAGFLGGGEAADLLVGLEAFDVSYRPATIITEIGEHTVTLGRLVHDSTRLLRGQFTAGTEVLEGVDAVVLATTRKPQAQLGHELAGSVDQLYVVGDALAPRDLRSATYEGHRFARFVGEHDVPRTMNQAIFEPPASETFAGKVPAGMMDAITV
jgi:2,4-dienoyl-CoA reductase-like NADH-dependent reductase (Old Yellow Enzyme family)